MSQLRRRRRIATPKGGGSFNVMSLSPLAVWDARHTFSRTGGQFTAASDQYLSATSNSTLQIGLGVPFWVSLWWNSAAPATGQYMCLVSKNYEFDVRMYTNTNRLEFTATGLGFVASINLVTPSVWNHAFCYSNADGTCGIILNGSTLATGTGAHRVVDNEPFLIGRRTGLLPFNGQMDNVLFGKPATVLGNGTNGSLAHTIATALFASGSGLSFQDITAQQETDWGIVSGWLDNSLTADAFGSNTLTNVNGVTATAGKVNASTVDNDPIYIFDDRTANNDDLANVTLATRPILKTAQFSTEPAAEFGTSREISNVGGLAVDPADFSAVVVFRLNSGATLAATTHNLFHMENGGGDFVTASAVDGKWRITNGDGNDEEATGTVEVNEIYIAYIEGTASNNRLFINGVLVAETAAAAGTSDCTDVVLDTIDGQIAYEAIFPTILTTAQQEDCFDYLLARFTTPGEVTWGEV